MTANILSEPAAQDRLYAMAGTAARALTNLDASATLISVCSGHLDLTERSVGTRLTSSQKVHIRRLYLLASSAVGCGFTAKARTCGPCQGGGGSFQ